MTKTNDSYEGLDKVLRQKFEGFGFNDFQVYFENGSNPGDGYLSDIVRAHVTGTKNGVAQYIDAIVKRATKDNDVRANVPTAGLFKREIFFFTEIVPIYEKLQRDFAIDDEYKVKFPKCYATNQEPCEELLVFENLKTQNYEMTEPMKLDYAHGAAALDTLAKLHALSFAFEKKYPEKFKEIANDYQEVYFGPKDDEYDPSLLKKFHQTCAAKAISSIKNDMHREKLRKATNELYEVTATLGNGGACRVLLHGDYWTNNIFYKYKDGEPVEVVPIDYQISHYASPAIDVTYLLTCNSDAVFRRGHYRQLLERYYNALDQSLKRFSINIEDVYPKELFRKDVREYSLYSLSYCFLFMVVVLIPRDENILEIWKNAHTFVASPAYVERINDLIDDFVSYGNGKHHFRY